MYIERKTFSVAFFLQRVRTSKKGLAPLLAQIATNGISKEVYIQCTIAPEKWSQAKERAIGKDCLSQQVNSYLNSYRAKILQVRQELIEQGYEGNAIEIKDRLIKTETSSRMFLAEFEKFKLSERPYEQKGILTKTELDTLININKTTRCKNCFICIKYLILTL